MAEWSKETLAYNLRHYMEQSGRSQKELAEIAGVSSPTFSDWINAKKYPRIDKIQKLADYFGILKSDLIENPKQETPTTPTYTLPPDILALLQKADPEKLREIARYAEYVINRE